MNVQRVFDVQLHPEEYEAFADGKTLRIPIDDGIVVLHPAPDQKPEREDQDTDEQDTGDDLEDMEVDV